MSLIFQCQRLRLLPLKEEDREKAIDKGLTPNTPQKKARDIIGEVHSTKSENASKSHSMTLEKKKEKAVELLNSKPDTENVKEFLFVLEGFLASNTVKTATKDYDKATLKKNSKVLNDFTKIIKSFMPVETTETTEK